MQSNVPLQLTERCFERVLDCEARAKILALILIVVAYTVENRDKGETAAVLHCRSHFAVEGF